MSFFPNPNKIIELDTAEEFRTHYGEAISPLRNCDRIEYQFCANSDAANAYLESLADKRGVMVRNSNLEDIFVELMGHQLN